MSNDSAKGKRIYLPKSIPSDPERVYAGAGWLDWAHFLGTTGRGDSGSARTPTKRRKTRKEVRKPRTR